MRIVFYKAERNDINISISVCLEDGKLQFDGYDYGTRVKEFRGISDEFEYYLNLDEANTTKAFEALGISSKSDQEKLEFIRDKFNKDGSFRGFEKYCADHGIETKYSSWP